MPPLSTNANFLHHQQQDNIDNLRMQEKEHPPIVSIVAPRNRNSLQYPKKQSILFYENDQRIGTTKNEGIQGVNKLKQRPFTIQNNRSRNDHAIRARYLSSLGIRRQSPSNHVLNQRTSSQQVCTRQCQLQQQNHASLATISSSQFSSSPRRARADSFHEILKKDHGETDEKLREELSMSSGWTSSAMTTSVKSMASSPASSTSSLSSMYTPTPVKTMNGCKASAVSFDSTVTVHPIPKRKAYSDRMWSQLWYTKHEQDTNIARNCIEFAAENWDANSVYMDDDMIATDDGERMHPVHFIESPYTQGRLMAILQATQNRNRTSKPIQQPQQQQPQDINN